MRPELAALAAAQSGLVLRRQAVEVGYTERELRTFTAVGGAWVVVRRGVYVARSLWESLEPDQQWRLRDVAAHLTMSRSHVLSHDSAARINGLPFLRPRQMLTHVTRPGVWGSRTEHGVKHHLSRLQPSIETEPGYPVTGLARTALDLGREHGFVTGVTAADAAMRRGVTDDDFADELDSMICWPYVTQARAAAEHADPGAENVGETLARLLVSEVAPELGPPRTQFPIRTPSRVAWCDLLLGCHVFEFDGRIKYLRPHHGGVADRPVEDVLWDEKKRQTEICAEGVGMSRIVWDDFWGAARAAAVRRLRAELDLSLVRFGDRLPAQLEAFASQLTDARRERISDGVRPLPDRAPPAVLWSLCPRYNAAGATITPRYSYSAGPAGAGAAA
jgi:hypothetical protein